MLQQKDADVQSGSSVVQQPEQVMKVRDCAEAGGLVNSMVIERVVVGVFQEPSSEIDQQRIGQ